MARKHSCHSERQSTARRPGRLTLLGAGALAATAITAVAVTAGTAAAAPAAFTRPATTAAAATTAAFTAPTRDLGLGAKGVDVKAVQERLAALKYYPGAIDGVLGADTQGALWAFQEINGLKVTGTVTAQTGWALVHPKSYKSPDYKGRRATRIEVNQALEVVVLYENNRIMLIAHCSSGGGYFFDGGTQAITPNGTYNTTVYLPGWVTVPLGEMYNPVFFIGTVFAIHGDTVVPVGPASHGCVRVDMDIAAFFHKMVKTPGTQVHVYGTPQWES
jgi:peptidoglycan hydrolase-like protein with peptidoglycan-binding domain